MRLKNKKFLYKTNILKKIVLTTLSNVESYGFEKAAQPVGGR